jgi:hypothetical protein
MLIRVMYRNGKYDMVKDTILGMYIDSGKINKFKRTDGWATIGIDPIRRTTHPHTGPERRTVT